VEVSYREIAKALDKSIQKLKMLLWKLYLKLPELADIYNTGIYLAGGGSMLRGWTKEFLKNRLTCLHCRRSFTVVRGTGMAKPFEI
jgi:rod shape-determining protein MreB